MGNYEPFFKDEELVGLKDPYPGMLYKARGFLNQPIRITFTNTGVHCGHSAHNIGAAADLGTGHLAEGFERDSYVYKLVYALMQAGFQRIEIAPMHVHADIGEVIQPDGTYPAPTLFMGQEA